MILMCLESRHAISGASLGCSKMAALGKNYTNVEAGVFHKKWESFVESAECAS